MRSLIIGFVVFLAACNGSSSSQPDPRVDALQAKLDKLTGAIAEATHIQAEQAKAVSKLTLIGKTSGQINEAGVTLFDFGPCADMGVLIGRGSSVSTPIPDPLSANLEAFQQCTGYSYNTLLGSGTIGTAPRIFWDGQNCTGNMLEWEAGGAGYNAQTLQNGVVFLSPVDGIPLMVESGQTPQPIMIQSAWVLSNPGCQSDIETQLVYFVTPNDTSITGVPIVLPKVPQLSPP